MFQEVNEMKIDTNTIASMTEANQNFSKVARMAESQGRAVIFKNNKPKFLVLDLESESYFEVTEEERLELAAQRVLARYKPALEELAK